MNTPIRLAIAGFGTIARAQHIPAVNATPGIELVAIADPRGGPGNLPSYKSLEALLAGEPGVDVVALCTPSQTRRALAETSLRAGKHVLLEKPPGTTVAEVEPLRALAATSQRTLFATWHSRFAPAVEPARAWLAGRRVQRVTIIWKEDVRVWHPGQDWIWQPGGLGVFDPGINALSILTQIMPNPVFVTGAELDFPANCEAPIAARLTLSDLTGAELTAEFDWRQTGPQTWDILVETDSGSLALHEGGTKLVLDGQPAVEAKDAEYPEIYRHLLQLIEQGASDVDLSPLQLVADSFLLGRRRSVEAFHDDRS